MKSMKERARRISGFDNRNRPTGGLGESLLADRPDAPDDAEADHLCGKDEVRCDLSHGLGTSSGDDSTSPRTASSSDLSHSSTAISVNAVDRSCSAAARRPTDQESILLDFSPRPQGRQAGKVSSKGANKVASPTPSCDSIWLPEVMREVQRQGAGVVSIEGGGIEALPTVRGEDVKVELNRRGFCNLPQLIPLTEPRCGAFAIASVDGSRSAATHSQLRALLDRERLSRFGMHRNDRCAVLLANGPELASAVLLCLSRCTCVPINIQQTSSEIRGELEGTGCKALIVAEGHDAKQVAALVDGLEVLVLRLIPDPGIAGLFSISPLQAYETTLSDQANKLEDGEYNSPSDTALVLHTSGTSGKKKMVPYSLETLCVGAACIMESWSLRADDVCLNMMPLFHVGGITRNILAAVLAGGGVVCAPAFDAALFWQVIQDRRESPVTWYYAGPTMHSVILDHLQELRKEPESGNFKPRLRMIANASGGLIASLAEKIQQEFGCVVLPSYGMTECMPISSPCCDYQLDRPNSSGQICGPAVRILDDAGVPLGVGEVGNVALKGAPLMEGYLNDEAANAAAYFPGGWFNTGDMGYLDKDGWIFLTGRSKEVINRGGEIISPFEIEEAILTHDRVKSVLAFAAPHDILQEVVGIAIVADSTRPRVDLLGIQKYVASVLHPSKWPQVLVYMDELPKGQANKVQRIRLAQRLGLTAVADTGPQVLRMFEAICPPHGSSLLVPVEKDPVHVDLQEIMSVIKKVQHALGIIQCVVVSGKDKSSGACVVYITPRTVDENEMMESLRHLLHDYLLPREIIKMDEIPDDYHSLPTPSYEPQDTGYVAARSKTEQIVQDIWEQVLERKQIGVESDFFEVGGSSLLAGRLIAQVRRSLGVALTAAAVFSNRTIAQLAATCDALIESSSARSDDKNAVYHPKRNQGIARWVDRINDHERLETTDGWVTSGFQGIDKNPRLKPYSQTAVPALICQALPLVLLYPLRRILTWLCFVALWMTFQTHYFSIPKTCTGTCSCPITGNHTVVPTPMCSDSSGDCSCATMDRLQALVLALCVGRLVANVFFPFLGILTKWAIIGKYRVGRYPIWGQYYLRWWYVDQVLMICGRGIFRYHPYLLNVYYRLMGAKIGSGVVIDPHAKLGEFDLISIGHNTAVDNVRLRAFCVDNGCMLLAPLRVGDDVSISCKVHLAPGIDVPDGASLGPNSSTYDLNPFTCREDNRRFCVARFPSPNLFFLFFGHLAVFLVIVVEQLPVLLVLEQMVLYPWYVQHLRSYRDVLLWFLTPGRVGFYIAIRVVRGTACPILRLVAVLILKRLVIGKFEPGPWAHSQSKILKRWLMERLLPGEKLQEVGHLIGSHYSLMSYVLRLLGAKVGDRIYWPGSSFEGLVEYDLLEVQDDVVFGSRSAILCADALECAPITIEAGANVSDRCVLLPGCTIGRDATMGSGSLTARGATYRAGSKWVGSKGGKAILLERGSAESANADTLRPFGKAFYLRQAPFYVFPSWLHLLVNTVSRCFAAVYRSLTLISVIQLTAAIIGLEHLKIHECTLLEIAGHMIPLFIAVQNFMTLIALAIAVGLKFAIIGTRKPGLYNWDEVLVTCAPPLKPCLHIYVLLTCLAAVNPS